jgi:pyridoxamine 5'-phosphate oxidase
MPASFGKLKPTSGNSLRLYPLAARGPRAHSFAAMQIADLRTEYTRAGLRRRDLHADPLQQFKTWFDQAVAALIAEPNAMTLATVDPVGQPSTRIVLLKAVDERGFCFYTNYQSRKSRELAANPRAALTFFWPGLERQVNICGAVSRNSREESASYYHSRPLGGRLGAWASTQSAVIPNREYLEKRLEEVTGTHGDKPSLPDYWGGFILDPAAIEFWQGRPSRLHDRFLYTKLGGAWKIERLSP